MFEADLDYDAFQGSLFIGQKKILLTRSNGAKAIAALFGDPYWKDEDDEGEVILFYERPGEVEWQFELGDRTSLKALNVLTPPLLKDPLQRQAYGVTAPWPPALDTMLATKGSSESPG